MHAILLAVMVIQLINQKLVVRCSKNPLEHGVHRFCSTGHVIFIQQKFTEYLQRISPSPILTQKALTGQRENIKSICTISLNYRWQIHGIFASTTEPGWSSHSFPLTIFLNTELQAASTYTEPKVLAWHNWAHSSGLHKAEIMVLARVVFSSGTWTLYQVNSNCWQNLDSGCSTRFPICCWLVHGVALNC